MFGKIVVDDKEASKGIDNVTRTAKQSEGIMSSSFKKIGAAVAGAFSVAAMVGFEKSVIETYTTFDDQMRKVQAVSGATSDAVTALRDKAKELGSATRFSATEAGEGMEALARAGWETEDVINEVGNVLAFATANSIDLGAAAELVSDGLNQFGLEAKDTQYFTDVLSQTAASSSTDVLGLKESLINTSGMVKVFGYDLEDVSVALGLMGDEALKGGAAGTSLNSAFMHMAKGGKDVNKAMKDLGINLYDANGNAKPLDTVLGDLRTSFGKLSDEQKAQYASTLFGTAGMKGMMAIIETSDEDFNNLTDAIKNSKDATQEMADIMDGGIGGAIESVKSAWEGLKIYFGELQDGFLVDAINGIASAIQALPERIDSVKDRIMTIKEAVSETAGVMRESFQPVVDALKDAFDKLKESMGPIVETAGNIMQTLEPLATIIGGVLVGAIGVAISIFTGLVSAIGPVINAFLQIIETVGHMVNVVIGLLTGDWQLAMDSWLAAGESIIGAFISLWEGLKNFVGGFVDAIVGFFQGLYDILVGNSIVPDMVNAMLQWFKDLASWIVDPIKTLVSFVVDAFNNLKQKASTIFNAIKDGITRPIETAKSIITTIVGAIRSVMTRIFGSIRDTTSRIFDRVKDAMFKPIDAAKDAISKALDAIKDMFSKLKLKFPKIERPKLPKFTLTGEFSIMPPRVPKIGIEWFKEGGILTKPTLFGFNPASGNIMGGGEAGYEAILPIEKLSDILIRVFDRIGYNNDNTDYTGLLNSLSSVVYESFMQAIVDSGAGTIVIDGRALTNAISRHQYSNLKHNNRVRGRKG